MNERQVEGADTVVEAELIDEPEAPDPHSLGLELPDDQGEAIDLLLSQVAAARTEADSYLEDLKRVAADFDNYRKRTTRESAAMLDRATENVIQRLMPVLDSFDAALGGQPQTDAEQNLYSGMVNTREQLISTLGDAGLEVIPTVDEAFDPEIHEPVGAPASNGALVVTEELRRGYRLGGKVLRAALVVVDVAR